MNGIVPLQDLVLQGPDELQPRPVPDVAEPAIGVGPEGPLHYPAVGRPVEERPVPLELEDPVDHLLRVDLGHPPVAQVLPLHDGIGEVHLPAVLGVYVSERRGDPSLGHHCVRLSKESLADDQSVGALVVGLDCRPHPCATCTHYQDVAC